MPKIILAQHGAVGYWCQYSLPSWPSFKTMPLLFRLVMHDLLRSSLRRVVVDCVPWASCGNVLQLADPHNISMHTIRVPLMWQPAWLTMPSSAHLLHLLSAFDSSRVFVLANRGRWIEQKPLFNFVAFTQAFIRRQSLFSRLAKIQTRRHVQRDQSYLYRYELNFVGSFLSHR